MKASELPAKLGEVRDLADRYKSGTEDAFDAARELLSLLLRLTVMDDREFLRETRLPNQPRNKRTIGVRSRPLPLNDGRYLRLVTSLSLDALAGDLQPKLRVYSASYQYQLDDGGEHWVLRYDYVRTPNNEHPASHVQLRADLKEPCERCLPRDTPLERIHFPTGRITLEAVIRLLAEQFQVPCNESPDIWRPILAETERQFEQIAHRPLSGPAI